MTNNKLELDYSTIKSLSKLINKENLAEIEVGNGENYVRIIRKLPENVIASSPASSVQAVQPVQSPVQEKTEIPIFVSQKDNVNAVKSPIVGTAYLAPSPDADNFVKVGQSVKKGDILIIVEAMKVMNPITATKDGKVEEILVSDAEPVEFDQSLVIVS